MSPVWSADGQHVYFLRLSPAETPATRILRKRADGAGGATIGRRPLLLPSSSSPLRGQVLPFFTNTAQTVGFESNAFRTFSRILMRNRFELEGREVADPQDRDVLVLAQVFAVPVRIDSDTVLTISVPVLHKELSFMATSSQTELSDSGLGDTTLLLKHRFGFTSDVLHRLNNEADGFRFGDETRVNWAVGYRLFSKKYRSFQDKVFNAYLEVNTHG